MEIEKNTASDNYDTVKSLIDKLNDFELKEKQQEVDLKKRLSEMSKMIATNSVVMQKS